MHLGLSTGEYLSDLARQDEVRLKMGLHLRKKSENDNSHHAKDFGEKFIAFNSCEKCKCFRSQVSDSSSSGMFRKKYEKTYQAYSVIKNYQVSRAEIALCQYFQYFLYCQYKSFILAKWFPSLYSYVVKICFKVGFSP